MNRQRIYIIATAASVAGLCWVFLHLHYPQKMFSLPVCIFRNITGLPCPSCGSTHSVLCLLKFDIAGAVAENPIGLILTPLIFILPPWLTIDFVSGRNSFYKFYLSAESFVRKPWVATCLIGALTANWIWSICKNTL